MTTIPCNLLLCLFFGLCFAACARAQLRSGAWPWRTDLLSLVLSFALLSVAPAAAYLYLLYPDWSWMYLVEPARLPVGTGLAVVVLTILMIPVGYFLGWLLLRLGGERGLFAPLGAIGMASGLLLLVLKRRLSINVRFEEFHSGLLRPIGQGKLLLALLCIGPIVWGAAVLVGRSLWAQGRWLRQQAAITGSRGGTGGAMSAGTSSSPRTGRPQAISGGAPPES